MSRWCGSKKAMTLVEISIASVVGLLVMGFIMYLFSASSRVVNIVTRQSVYQQSASLALDKMSDLLRNAKQQDFPPAPSNSVLYFRQKEKPDQVSEISLDDGSNIIYFYPNKDTRSDREVLAKNIEVLQFQVTPEYLVEVVISFRYPRYGTILSGDPSKGLGGTMRMQILPRSDTLY